MIRWLQQFLIRILIIAQLHPYIVLKSNTNTNIALVSIWLIFEWPLTWHVHFSQSVIHSSFLLYTMWLCPLKRDCFWGWTLRGSVDELGGETLEYHSINRYDRILNICLTLDHSELQLCRTRSLVRTSHLWWRKGEKHFSQYNTLFLLHPLSATQRLFNYSIVGVWYYGILVLPLA